MATGNIYEGMTSEELEKLNNDLWNQRQALKREQLEINAVMTRRAAEDQVYRAAEKAGVKVQILGPAGVASAEAHGEGDVS